MREREKVVDCTEDVSVGGLGDWIEERASRTCGARVVVLVLAVNKTIPSISLHHPVASPIMPSKSVATKPPASGSEDEIGASDQENSRPAPPKINRTVVKKPVKKATTAATKKTTTKTKPAKEPIDPPEAGDADEPEPAMEPAPKPKQRKRVLKKDLVAKTAAPAPEPESVPEPDSELAPAPAKKAIKSTKSKTAEAQSEKEKPVAKPKPKTKRAPSPEPAPVIPETQPEPTEIEQSIVEDEPPADLMDIDREPSPPPPPPKTHSRQRSASIQRQAAPGAVYSRARSTSRQPGTYSRGRSASDTERRVAESEANRRLADMTKKYEEMRMKYDSVIELGPKAAEANFERLKKATDQKAKGETRSMTFEEFTLTICVRRCKRPDRIPEERTRRNPQDLVSNHHRLCKTPITSRSPDGRKRQTQRRAQSHRDKPYRITE
jgi:hypothetical protein